MNDNTCGDCGQLVTRFGHAPDCRRLRLFRLVDSDARVDRALREENGLSPRGRARYIVFVAEKAIEEGTL